MSLSIARYTGNYCKQRVGSGKFKVGDIVAFELGGLRKIISNQEGLKYYNKTLETLNYGYIFLRNLDNDYVQYNHEDKYKIIDCWG